MQYKTKIINSDLNSIPWDEANRVYVEAADKAVSLATEQALAVYDANYNISKEAALKRAGISSEANYEGDLGLEYIPPSLSKEDRDNIRRKAGNAALEEYFIKPYHIKSWGIKLLDQIMASYSKHILNNAGKDGKICGLQYLKDNLDLGSGTDMGIYRFLMMNSRSSYLEKMGSGESKKYCTLVPLILYSHKRYHDVPYSSWDRGTLEYVVNSLLCEAMLSDVPTLSSSRLIELRDRGLEVMSGAKAGQTRPAHSTYGLYRLKDTEIGELNQLAQIMLTQVWAAHPTNRTKYMILNPADWDNMPLPLVGIDIFIPKPAVTINTRVIDDPWK